MLTLPQAPEPLPRVLQHREASGLLCHEQQGLVAHVLVPVHWFGRWFGQRGCQDGKGLSWDSTASRSFLGMEQGLQTSRVWNQSAACSAPAEAAGTGQERRGARWGEEQGRGFGAARGGSAALVRLPAGFCFSCVTLSRDPRDPGGGGVLHLNYRVPGESRGLLFVLNLPAADFS